MKGGRTGPEEPGRPKELRPLGAALTVKRWARRLGKGQLARNAGLPEKAVRALEAGERDPTPAELVQLSGALGTEPARLRDMASLLAAVERLPPGAPLAPAAEALDFWRGFGAALTSAALGAALPAARLTPEEAGPERRRARESWRRLSTLRGEDLRRAVEAEPLFWRWGFAERLCQASVTAAAGDHGQALELAELALTVTERMAGEPELRNRFQGYAWAFIANARRVGGDLAGADRDLPRARSLWEAGSSADPGLLDEARFLEIEGSLRREQRRFPEALACLETALSRAKPGARPELLINLANVLIDMTRHEEAIPQLEEAVRLIDSQAAPRPAWAARFNLLACLCALDRAAEGEAWLPELRRLALELDNDLDRIRFRWLEGQVHSALGRREEAIPALEEARDGFAARGMLYDVALVSLELCVLLLQEGRTGEVKAEAPRLAEIFQQLGIERERLASLTLFCAAAEAELATVEEARFALELMRGAERSSA